MEKFKNMKFITQSDPGDPNQPLVNTLQNNSGRVESPPSERPDGDDEELVPILMMALEAASHTPSSAGGGNSRRSLRRPNYKRRTLRRRRPRRGERFEMRGGRPVRVISMHGGRKSRWTRRTTMSLKRSKEHKRYLGSLDQVRSKPEQQQGDGHRCGRSVVGVYPEGT